MRLKKREELIDYKFYCFDGEPKFLYVAVAGFIDGERHDKLTYLDLIWNRTLFGRSDHQLLPFDVRKPNHLDEMIDIARKLSTAIPFVRVDLYNINDVVYFSELTFYPGSGLGLFSPETAEIEIGSWIDLSKV